MRCKICQTENHSYLIKGKGCGSCYDRIFADITAWDKDTGYGWSHQNGEVLVLWADIKDINGTPLNIFFHYDSNKTVFTRMINEKSVTLLELNQIMPCTLEFLDKARKNIKLWQVFS